jgi:hypothetical protein
MFNISTKTAFIALLTTFSSLATAATYYVSPTGTSSGNGSIDSPFDFTSGIAKSLVGGDSLIVCGGTYNLTSTQSMSKSGSTGKYLQIVAYPGETPILDFRKESYSSSSQGVKLTGNYVHFKGIIIQGAGDNGLQVTGSNNIIELCTTRWNCDAGTQMKTGSNNLILNCDSYENFDYESGGISSPNYGGNADGFADKQYTNTGTNTYKGCRSWRNGDDGWDSYQKVGNTVYDSCWCYSMAPLTFDMTDNIRFKTDSASWFYQFKNSSGRYVMKNYGNGNGFKMGGAYTAHNATAHNCISVGNQVKGFDQNNNDGLMTLYNCTSYNNGINYGYTNNSYGTLIIKNCVSLNSIGSNSFNCKSVTQSYNTWNTGFTCSSSDFTSLDYSQMLNDRKSDGSLPEIALLHLTPTSGLIDKGTNVGFSYFGLAPDLGAYEYNPNLTAITTIKAIDISVCYSAVNQQIFIQSSLAYVEVYKVTGESIYAKRVFSNSLNIPVNNVSKGVFIVRVISQNGDTSTNKILID